VGRLVSPALDEAARVIGYTDECGLRNYRHGGESVRAATVPRWCVVAAFLLGLAIGVFL
jgi:hypothetical protein